MRIQTYIQNIVKLVLQILIECLNFEPGMRGNTGVQGTQGTKGNTGEKGNRGKKGQCHEFPMSMNLPPSRIKKGKIDVFPYP